MQLPAEFGQVALGMALPDKHWQVRAQPGEPWITAKGRGAQCPADVPLHLDHCSLHQGAGTAHVKLGIGPGVGIDPRRALAQPGRCAGQGGIDGTQVRLRVGVVAWSGAGLAQGLGQGPRGAVPAGGDAGTAMPETGRCTYAPLGPTQ